MALLQLIGTAFRGRLRLAAENVAMRQQLANLLRERRKPKLDWSDRLFWVTIRRLFADWKSWLVIVKPDTVAGWHRQGFRLFWRWKSRGRKPGRPTIASNVIALIRRMAKDNVTWGAPRIQAELHLLGHDLAEAAVAKYMPRPRKPPSQTWKTFLKNHADSLVSIDFFVVPTATFRVLYGFVILDHNRRRILHLNVTDHPTATWVCQQFREALPFDTTPKYLIRDRDGVNGKEVPRCLEAMGIEEVLTAPRSPWQNPYCERLIGTLRRELLDHVIVLNERHLMRLLREFVRYYHTSRTHRSLGQNAPEPRKIELQEQGDVIAIPYLGGLHHHYTRAA